VVSPLNRAWLDCLPADCTRYDHLQVQADGQPWSLVASRVHPTTGQLNALLLSPDRRRLVMAPAGEVAGFPGQKGVSQVYTPEQKGAAQIGTPVEQPVVEPAAVVSLPVAAAKVLDPDQKGVHQMATPGDRLDPDQKGLHLAQTPGGTQSLTGDQQPKPKPKTKPRARTPLDVAANKLAREFKGEVIAVDPIGCLLEQELGLPEGSCS
jgi:hypothetical protein